MKVTPSTPRHRNGPDAKAPASSKPSSSGSNRTPLISISDATANDPSKTLVVLLDLSGNEPGATEWAMGCFPEALIKPLDKIEMKWGSKLDTLRRIRELDPAVFAAFTSDITYQSRRGLLALFGVGAGARTILIGDAAGYTRRRSRIEVFVFDLPRFILEALIGYGVVLPLSWLITVAIGLSLPLRRVVRGSTGTPRTNETSRTLLYLRGTLSGQAEGGMITHVEGFVGGALGLGHRVNLIESGRDTESLTEPRADAGRNAEALTRIRIAPSDALTATKPIFELWNNLVFTFKCLQLLRSEPALDQIDFLYQRYSRFNWTGAVLSLLTGLPLALEYNGSEVWVGRQWDPVGQRGLLRMFERVNLEAADLVFAVSSVERQNLITAGVESDRIVVNANGVDTRAFTPGCGGLGIRRRIGAEDRIVVGFVGTFGPWHGASVLAEAARALGHPSHYHFLLIGDGERRSEVEAIFRSCRSGVEATFTGKVPHDEVPAYLDACDVLASPHVALSDGSDFFGSPTKLFEYMAMARPIVASRLGQMADVIRDGENGLLVKPGDAKALARAIELLGEDPALRARLGKAARQRVIEHFTWSHNAARVFDAMEPTI
jgi:glycosyltransferase involved in cell wall biosynthesis